MDLGQWGPAAVGFGKLARETSAVLGPGARQVVIVQSWLAFALMNTGQRDEAFALAQTVETVGLPLFGPNHEATDRASLLLAVRSMLQGDIADAQRRLEASYAWNRTQGDADRTASVGALLAQVYQVQGRQADADSLALRGTASDAVMTLMETIRASAHAGDDAGVVTAADGLIRRPEAPQALKVLAVIARANALRRLGRADEAIGSLRTVLAAARQDGDAPLDIVALEESLAAALLPFGDDDLSDRDPAVLNEAFALWQDSLSGSTAVLGARHPATLNRRADFLVRLVDADRVDEAYAAAQALITDDDAGPAHLSQDRRALVETSLATVLLKAGRGQEGYDTLRRAAATYQAFALSSPHRDDARALIASRSYLFRNQVTIGWTLANTPAP
ncbi:hypothetical protein BH10PSE2_BH10PSE2_30100 [soil metagenome]